MRVLLSAALVALAVVASPFRASAAPIDYSFAGVLGDCEVPFHGGCLNGLSGLIVVGEFAFDPTIGTFSSFDFELLGGDFIWVSPRIPDPWPIPWQQIVYSANSGLLSARVTIPTPSLLEHFSFSLGFTPLLDGTSPVVVDGYIARSGAVSLFNRFVTGRAEPVPEPSSLLLIGTGLVVGLRRLRQAARRSPPNP